MLRRGDCCLERLKLSMLIVLRFVHVVEVVGNNDSKWVRWIGATHEVYRLSGAARAPMYELGTLSLTRPLE